MNITLYVENKNPKIEYSYNITNLKIRSAFANRIFLYTSIKIIFNYGNNPETDF